VDLAARVARLTAGQKACLDLVDDHATSKEIALRIGISRHTVDARLRQAIQILGVTSRREAAVIWRAAATAEAYQPFAYQPSQIVSEADAQDQGPAHWNEDGDDGWKDDAAAGTAHSAWAQPLHSFKPAPSAPHEVRDSLAWSPAGATAAPVLPRLWGGANDLTVSQRLVGILVITILAMLAFGLLLSGIGALSQLHA